VYPNVVNSAAGQQFDMEGAVMYLSEKSKDSLVVKLYLMNDVNSDYSELSREYAGGSYPFPFYYQGFRGPLTIWSVNTDIMSNIIVRPEFYSSKGEYAEMDSLQFVK